MLSFFQTVRRWMSRTGSGGGDVPTPPVPGEKILTPGNHVVGIFSQSSHEAMIFSACEHLPKISAGTHEIVIFAECNHSPMIHPACEHYVNLWTS